MLIHVLFVGTSTPIIRTVGAIVTHGVHESFSRMDAVNENIVYVATSLGYIQESGVSNWDDSSVAMTGLVCVEWGQRAISHAFLDKQFVTIGYPILELTLLGYVHNIGAWMFQMHGGSIYLGQV